MHSPPASGNQQQFVPAPLLDPIETTLRPTPVPLAPPDLSPLPSLDLLQDPTQDLGSCFRHSGWAPTRRRIGAAIATTFPDSDRLVRFAGCGSRAWVVKHPDHDRDYRVMADHCHDRFCVPCAAVRSRTIVSNLLPRLGERTVRFVTLTLWSDSSTRLKPLLDKLYRSFALLRRRVWWAKRVLGGFAMLEVKYVAHTQRWHPHLHVLCQGNYLPQPELSAIWHNITHDSFIVDVRSAHDEGHVAWYVTKYTSKPGDYSTMHSVELLQEMVLALAGRRLCSTFGTFQGLNLLDRGEPTEWIYVESLWQLTQRATAGNPEAQAILRIIHATPENDEPSQHELPFPDS